MSSAHEFSWGADLIRATVFGQFDHSIGEDWWRQLSSDEPDTENKQPKQGIYTATIERDTSVFTLQIQPGRADVLLKAKDSAPPASGFPNIGAFELIVPDFGATVEKWLSSDIPLYRLAFGSVLYLTCEDQVEAYERLRHFLPSVAIDPQGSRDLLYQINRPRPIEDFDEPIEINRLNKWSVLRLTQGLLDITSGSPVVSPAPEEIIAIRLELDINTPANWEGNLPTHRNASLFHELIEAGLDISRNGDQ